MKGIIKFVVGAALVALMGRGIAMYFDVDAFGHKSSASKTANENLRRAAQPPAPPKQDQQPRGLPY